MIEFLKSKPICSNFSGNCNSCAAYNKRDGACLALYSPIDGCNVFHPEFTVQENTPETAKLRYSKLVCSRAGDSGDNCVGCPSLNTDDPYQTLCRDHFCVWCGTHWDNYAVLASCEGCCEDHKYDVAFDLLIEYLSEPGTDMIPDIYAGVSSYHFQTILIRYIAWSRRNV
jgi:hypothetical protein